MIDAGYDVILCDRNISVLRGIELLKHIVLRAPSRASRVVFMMERLGDASLGAHLEALHRRLLVKPFDFASLRALARRREGVGLAVDGTSDATGQDAPMPGGPEHVGNERYA